MLAMFGLLAEAGTVHPVDQMYLELAVPFLVVGMFFWFLTLVYSAFWIWMLVHCFRTEPDRFFWIWLMVIIPFPGALIYGIVRYLPEANLKPPEFMRRWTRGKELQRLESAAQQIGNPHQFVQWGEALNDVGRVAEAQDAFQQAVDRDPRNCQALWGLAQTQFARKQYEPALYAVDRVLEIDPQYKFGDASFLKGRCLMELGREDEARDHLAAHVRRWRHPEALYRLAVLQQKSGDVAAARQTLVAMLQDLATSPAAIARKFGRWKSRAKKMLRGLLKA